MFREYLFTWKHVYKMLSREIDYRIPYFFKKIQDIVQACMY